MILKALMLQGFKSFPDKTEIQFSNGITAIVGPNGSGKSNISDAIRWVLGEQSSRSLRGAKMEDVIFGGTSRRAPLGFAEVSLVLSNETGVFRMQATEIMVTRRYYRSGESEYFLNRQHCRLRDIHELFMDTGLGRDGYSLIGQGRIDEILSLKSEDRRDVFEEAAGIRKFRYRKEEAARKLAQTEENLVRIRDVYTELETQYAPLEQQAQKAQTFLLLRDELRVLEVTLWLQNLQSLAADTAKTETDCTNLATQLADAQAAQAQTYATQQEIQAQSETCAQQTEQQRASLQSISQQHADCTSQIAVLRTKIAHDEQNIVRATQAKSQRQEQAQTLLAQMERHEQRLADLQQAHAGLQQQLTQTLSAQAQTEAEKAALLAQKERAQQAHDQLEQQHFALEMAQNTAQTALDSMDERKAHIIADAQTAAQTLQDAQHAAAQKRQQLDDCLRTVGQIKNQMAGVALKQNSRRTRLEQASEQLTQVQRTNAAAQQRLHMLQELQRDYDGYARSVKTIMHQRDGGRLTGIHGTVTSLIAVQQAHVTAIETALGAAASHIVVENTAVGKACIAYLKRSDGGRATFLPLDTIKPQQLQERNLTQFAGVCGTADTLVDCPPQYRSIVQNLLARTVVATDMDSALALAKATRNRFRIVTLDGQMLQVGGAMTGGSTGKSSGVLARGAQIATLQAQQAAQQQAAQNAQQAVDVAKRDLFALEDDLRRLEADNAQNNAQVAGLQASVDEQGALLHHLTQTHAALVAERDHMDAAKQGYQDTILQTQTALAENQQQRQIVLEEIQQLTQQVEAQLATQQDQLRTHTKYTADAEANRQAHTATAQALQELTVLRREMEQGVATDAADLHAFAAQIVTLQAELDACEQTLSACTQTQADMQAQLDNLRSTQQGLEQQRTQLQQTAQAQNEQILQLEREHARLTNKLDQCKQQEQHTLDLLWDTYELTPTPAAQIAVPLADVNQANQQVRTLRQKMRALGNVNLDAVEQFAQLAERYTFLGAQKTDLETAQQELHKVIDQLVEQMEAVFAAQFALLNEHFGQTFTEMFGGGSASLVLTDPKDVLGCGIDIRVCPPGKAVKTITLLSGGERAFVAIALYFAILKVRPTPFCILDEIEAALDDVNVVRYAKYLRRLEQDTQFIVITHRRGTMEEADMLYGVTMQEQGVSKMLMLNLKQAAEVLEIEK